MDANVSARPAKSRRAGASAGAKPLAITSAEDPAIGAQRGDNLIKGLFEVPREHVAPERVRRPEMGIVIAGQRPRGAPGLP